MKKFRIIALGVTVAALTVGSTVTASALRFHIRYGH